MAEEVTKNSINVPAMVENYLNGIAKYLSAFRSREGLTQNEMAQRLGLSLNRYREYEQNTTDNSKGVSLDLLLKIAILEGFDLPSFLNKIGESSSGISAVQAVSHVDLLEEALLVEWRNVPLDDRLSFVRLHKQETLPEATGRENEPLIPQKMRWSIRVANLLVQLPYEIRMKFEREVIEEYMDLKRPAADSSEHAVLLERLRDLIKQYYTNFESSRR